MLKIASKAVDSNFLGAHPECGLREIDVLPQGFRMIRSHLLMSLLLALQAIHYVAGQEVASDVVVTVDTKTRQHAVSPYLAGACIEDVNHEIYGGLYSQMIFGESFQEPSSASPIDGFKVVGGDWSVKDGVLYGGDGSGPKLVSDQLVLVDGEVSVEMRLPGERPGNGGFILSTSEAKVGADNFSGYEVSLFADTQQLLIGRHQGDFRPAAICALQSADGPVDSPASRDARRSIKRLRKRSVAGRSSRPTTAGPRCSRVSAMATTG